MSKLGFKIEEMRKGFVRVLIDDEFGQYCCTMDARAITYLDMRPVNREGKESVMINVGMSGKIFAIENTSDNIRSLYRMLERHMLKRRAW